MSNHNWQRFSLSKICEINPGKKELEKLSKETEVSFLPMACVSEDGKMLSQEKRKLKNVIKGFTYFRDEDVLLAKITPCFENGKRAIAKNLLNGVGFGSTEFHVLRPNGMATSRWLFYAISQDNFRNIAKSQMTGTAGQKRVPKRVLEEFEIPIPDINEQAIISEKIETQFTRLDAAIKSLKTIKNKLEIYRQSVLKAAFEGKLLGITDSVKWKRMMLGDLIIVKSGEGLYKTNRDEAGKYYVYGGNGVTGRHSKYMFEESRLIIGRVGAQCGNIHITEPKSWITDNAFIVTFDQIQVDLKFLFNYLKYLKLNSYSSSIAQPVISGRKLYPIKIRIPSKILEQKKIVEEIESRFSVIDKVEEVVDNALLKSDRLRKSILKAAFEGKLAD